MHISTQSGFIEVNPYIFSVLLYHLLYSTYRRQNFSSLFGFSTWACIQKYFWVFKTTSIKYLKIKSVDDCSTGSLLSELI